GLHAARIRQAHSSPQWTAVCPGSSPRGLFTGGAEPWGGPAVKKSPPNFGGLYAGPGPDELHHAHQDQTKQLLGSEALAVDVEHAILAIVLDSGRDAVLVILDHIGLGVRSHSSVQNHVQHGSIAFFRRQAFSLVHIGSQT